MIIMIETAPISFLRLSCVIAIMTFLSVPKTFGQQKYTLNYTFSGKDTSYNFPKLGLEISFPDKSSSTVYISKLPAVLTSKGFPASSIDSVFYDSTSARVELFLGDQYKWIEINTDSVDQEFLYASGWNTKQFENKVIDFRRLQLQEEKLLAYFENNGYPFAEVSLSNVTFLKDQIKADLMVRKGPLYHIDSIRVYGKIKINNLFLQQYFGITNGSIYDNQKLRLISSKLLQLPYLHEQQPWDVSMLGTGSILNLYLQPKKSSEFNVLVGFLPANTTTGKTQITGDVHLNLKNSLGHGENILLNWQQLQPQSPKLNLGFNHPYIFKSAFGIDFSLDLLKRDSSYVQFNSQVGLQYVLSSTQFGKIFYQSQRTFLLSGGIDSSSVIATKTLPPNIDVGSGNFGVNYNYFNTNYRLNPRKGNELEITATAGIKKVTKNNEIINFQDPSNPAFNFNTLYDSIKLKIYQLRIIAAAAHYYPLGKSSTLKTAVHIGWYQSPQIFRNELFQIGGYQLLRGFDEESIYTNRYAVFTAEYRYLIGINSYLFGFTDAGLAQTKYLDADYSNNYLSVGFGLEFETKLGLLNLSYAIGKRNDIKFDIRNASKIHFGYINYF